MADKPRNTIQELVIRLGVSCFIVSIILEAVLDSWFKFVLTHCVRFVKIPSDLCLLFPISDPPFPNYRGGPINPDAFWIDAKSMRFPR